MPSIPPFPNQSDDRASRLSAIVRDVAARRMDGQSITDHEVVASHPDLDPGLSVQLRALARVEQARSRARDGSLAGQSTPPAAFDVLTDVHLIPGYEIVRAISRGGQGVVYQAIQKSTRRTVAVKVMREGPFTGASDKSRFDREVRVLGQLRHPNIVAIHDSGVAAGHFFFVMDYIEGCRLDEHPANVEKSKNRNIETRNMLLLFAKIADAVHIAHLRGIIHRDLKPGNILVDAEGEPHILDFGLAKIAPGEINDFSQPTAMTITGQFIGSLPWASPEQADSRLGGIDVRTDVYSLGVVLYHAFTGQFPYSMTGNIRDVIDHILRTAPLRPSALRRDLDGEIEAIILKCLQKEPQRRYQSAGELARDIRHYLAGEPIEARRESTLYVLRKNIRRYRVPLGILSAFVLLLAASTVVAWTLYQRSQDRLWESYLVQARANRKSTQAGRRFDALDALAKAAAIRQSLELRNEAVMAMSLVDLRVERILESGGDWGAAWFDWNMKYYALADSKGNLVIKSTNDSREMARFAGDGKSVRFIRTSPNGRFVAAQYQETQEPGEVRVFDLEQPTREPLRYAAVQMEAFCFAADSNAVGLVASDGHLYIYELRDGRERKRFMVGEVIGVCFAPDGRRIAVLGKKNNRVEVRELNRGEPVAHLDLPDQHEILCYMRWHPDEDMVAFPASDLSVTLWEPGTGRVRKLERADKEQAYYIQFNHQGDLLASTGWERVTRLWDWFSAREHVSIPGMGRAFSPDGRRMGFARYSSSQKFEASGIWELAANRECRVLTLKKATARSIGNPAAVSPDGSLIVSPDGPGLRIWETHHGKDLAFIDPGTSYLRGDFPPSGDSLITFGERGILRWPLRHVADVLHVGPPRVLYGHEIPIVSLSADGSTLVANDYNPGTVRVLDLNKADGVRTIPDARATRGNVAINHDGSLVATSAGGNFAATGLAQEAQIKIWDSRSGALLHTLPPRGTFNLEFSQNGRWLLASNDEEYVVWDCASWQLAKRVARRTETSSSLANVNSPDGLPAALARDRVTYLDPRTLEPLLEIEALTDPKVRFLPDSPLVPIALLVDPVIMLWDMRKVREQLAKMNLDWDAPPYPPAPPSESTEPLRVEVDLGELAENTKVNGSGPATSNPAR